MRPQRTGLLSNVALNIWYGSTLSKGVSSKLSSSNASSSSSLTAPNFWAYRLLLAFPGIKTGLIAYFFIEELQVSGALILDVSLAFVAVVCPSYITFPFLFLVLIIIVFVERKVSLFSGFFSI